MNNIALPLLLLTAGLVLVQPSAGQSGTWTPTGDLITGRWNHTATLLPDGMVLVAGGSASGGSGLKSAELYDPASGTWTPPGLARSPTTHDDIAAQRQVLVTGGLDDALPGAEL
jgi:hypothetical protein